MAQSTGSRVLQVLGIIGGLVGAYFLFTWLFNINLVLGWVVFVIALVLFLIMGFLGINPFSKKAYVGEGEALLDKEVPMTKGIEQSVRDREVTPSNPDAQI